MIEIELTRIARELTTEQDVLGCIENVGYKPAKLPGRGICPLTGKEIVLNDVGFCMAADCEKNTTTAELLNYGWPKYLQLIEERKHTTDDVPRDVDLD
jgi:hypothetical protein